MAEKTAKAPSVTHHLFRLQRNVNGFFCPDSRIHLIGGLRPQAKYPAGVGLTPALKRALLGGTIIDVNGTVTQEELEGKTVVTGAGPAAKSITQALAEAGHVIETKLPITEVEVDAMSRSELLDYVKKNKINLNQYNGSLNNKSATEEWRDALKVHLGFIELPTEKE
jgi:hypothetical protein